MFEILDDVELPTVVTQTINLEQFYNQAADNKYKLHYQRLVERAKSRWLSGYYEKHHVIPKCLGGLDESDNMVRLTAEEHYVAHQLLVKMFPNSQSLSYGAFLMTTTGKGSRSQNKYYGWLRKKLSNQTTGKAKSEETRRRMSESLKTRVRTEESKRKTSETLKGNKLSAETKQKISEAMKNRVFTDEHRANISKALKGKTVGRKGSEAQKQAVAEANRKRVITPEIIAKRIATRKLNRKLKLEQTAFIEWSAK